MSFYETGLVNRPTTHTCIRQRWLASYVGS